MKVVSAIFLLLALFDAFVGGTVSARLQVGGWTAQDQRVNNYYQVVYAVFVAATLGGLFFSTRSTRQVLAILILYAGYVEDTLFYLLIPLVNPVIKFFNNGTPFLTPSGGLLPESISGWLGWVGRMVLGHNVSFEMRAVLLINLVAVILALWLFSDHVKSDLQKASPTSHE